MKLPLFILLAAQLLALAMASRAADQAKPASKPNVLLILADDLGYGDVSCYNDRAKVPTPNLDRLAREGRRFTDHLEPARARRLGPERGPAGGGAGTLALALGLWRHLFSPEPARPECRRANDHSEPRLCHDPRRRGRAQGATLGRSHAAQFGPGGPSADRGRWRRLDLESGGRPLSRCAAACGFLPCQPASLERGARVAFGRRGGGSRVGRAHAGEIEGG